MPATHEVLNQSAPLEDYNLFAANAALHDALAFNLPRERLAGARERLARPRRRARPARNASRSPTPPTALRPS